MTDPKQDLASYDIPGAVPGQQSPRESAGLLGTLGSVAEGLAGVPKTVDEQQASQSAAAGLIGGVVTTAVDSAAGIPPVGGLPPILPPSAPTPVAPTPPPGKKHPTINPIKFFFWLLVAFVILFALLIVMMIVGLSAADTVLTSFGLDPVNFKNWTIGLVNVFFGGIAVTAVIRMVVKAASLVLARKDEMAKRKKAIKSLWISGLVLSCTLGLWFGVYTYVQKFLVTEMSLPVEIIAFDPKTNTALQTLGLTSPFTMNFSAERITGEYAAQNDIVSYEWDKDGDGIVDATGEKVQLYFQDGGKANGVYKLMLTVRMQPKGGPNPVVKTFEKTISIANQTMYGEITSSVETGEAPLPIDFDASTITHPRGAPITKYSWDYNCDTQPDLEGAGFRRVSYTFEHAGEQTICLSVTARFEGKDEVKDFKKTITVKPSQAIVSANATFTASPKTGIAPLPVILDASDSGRATTLPISRYEWLIDNGEAKLSGRTVSYIFQKPGDHLVTLRVIYSSGDMKVDSLTVRVQDAIYAPQAVIAATPKPAVDGAIKGPSPLKVDFDASGSKDAKNSIVSYGWDFGDGTHGDGSAASHVYRATGTYRVRLTVTNADGLTHEAVTQVVVDDQLPVVSLGASKTTGTVPFTVDFDASGSSFSGKQIVSYEWAFVSPTGQEYRSVNERAQASREFTDAGSYQVKLTLVAADGTRADQNMVIIANPPALRADVSASRLKGPSPLMISFSSAKSTGAIARREWNFNDGTPTSTESSPQHLFNKPGTYHVVLRVFDASGAVNSASETVTVE